MPAPHTIVLAIDGLRASALGAYGGAAVSTPALDRLACDAVLCEWVNAPTADLLDLYRSFASHAAAWRQKRLITDDPSVAQHEAVAWFDEAVAIQLPAPSGPASGIGSTSLAQSLSAVAEELQALAADATESPALTWLHCRGLACAWDAPAELIAQLVDEEDPIPPAEIAPARGEVNLQSDPDAVFAASCRYAAQIAVLDACLEGFLEVLEEAFQSEPPVIVFMGLRGYGLGEHGLIGLEEGGPYSDWRHVPLLIRTPDSLTESRSPGRRWNKAPLATAQLAPVLAELSSGAESELDSMLDSQATEVLVLDGPRKSSVLSREWRLVYPSGAGVTGVLPAECELYVKPDDRWETNDVASLRPEVVAEMLAAGGRKLAD